ncbi:hypothetical protein [Herbaspirillum sp.]|jgi:hypothetical protein|uniref:hypothetical protein n=1 Tax=Herbaspirillum sp. TaxID=1890675 RepID=UPI000C0B5840|nr:hypothetical protein [Herbaspirillum sp.]MAF06187.1 hypothetical protein [Herbaspirillum sp.]|tara:strand:+ start:18652 stop:18927 length:276 start_codon:yes stop_codon:yes gene_type:complete
MSKEYRIETLMDVFKNVPKDRIKLCMAELAEGLVHGRYLQELHDQIGWGDHCVFPGYLTWIDDDEGTYDINITNNGEPFADIRIHSKEKTQ